MFAGHIGAAMLAKRIEPDVNLGYYVALALLADALLAVFVWMGWEHVMVPPDFATAHYLQFVFPYSHGLAATLLYSSFFFILFWKWPGGCLRAGVAAAVAFASHFVLDALVHVPELPLFGEASLKVGFSLWQNMSMALTLEALLTLVCLVGYLYLPSRRTSTRRKWNVWLGIVTGLLIVVTVAGQSTATQAPPIGILAATWVANVALLAPLYFWLDSRGD